VELLGYLALGGLLLISRVLLFGRWRRYELSHRQAAAFWASTTPLLLVVFFAIRGIDSLGGGLVLGGLVAFTFATSYAIALYFLRAFGGEMDPPTSSGYRRRP
jgi:fucose permease